MVVVACSRSATTPATPAPLVLPIPTIAPSPNQTAIPQPFWLGVDASYLPEIEANGGLFIDEGVNRPLLDIVTAYNLNMVRLRLWVNPANGTNNLPQTLALAQRVKQAGLAFLLDLHYSDTWADPAHQSKPAIWANLTGEALNQAVYEYTQDTIAAFKAQNSLPDIVQIGNEISGGLLWPDGRVGVGYEDNWPQLIGLLQAGVNGVRDSLPEGESVLIMLHLDAGGNNEVCRWFFDQVVAAGLPFDLIGLSYYPWWHGTLGDMAANVNDLAVRYAKPIVIVETAYPWTLDWQDETANLVGMESQLHSGYPASPAGQRAFMRVLIRLIRTVPNGLGWGVIYWAADAITTPTQGSIWENMALFDFAGNRLPVWDILGEMN